MSSLWALLLICIGCTERGGEEPKTVNTAPYLQSARSAEEVGRISSDLSLGDGEKAPPMAELAPQHSGEDLSLLAGERDTANRFPSAVIVIADVPNSRWRSTQCSGVLVAPRLVLTAGHCVCKPRKLQEPGREDMTLIDGSTCTTSALVKTVIYEPTGPQEDLSLRSREYKGKVRPHPEFKILLDAQGNVLSSKADLAVIHLGTPVRAEHPPMPLAEVDVEAHESLVTVSYGSDEALGWVSDHRHFSRHKVTRAAAAGDERFLLEQPQRRIYRGDSGGPVLREREQGFVLVGVSARGLGSAPGFTGMFPYRAWVRDELHHATPPAPAVPH